MGFEYRIRCDLPESVDYASVLAKLDNPVDSSGWSAFDVAREPSGFYFCDHGRSVASAVALKDLVDYCLGHTDQVIVEEC
jgi:hypothetical protein